MNQDIPVLTDLLPPGSVTKDLQQVDITLDEVTFSHEFYEFFWRAEVARQRLFEKFNYQVIRRLELLTDGAAVVKFVFPPYGKGEPGTQPRQTTLSVGSGAAKYELEITLSYLHDALNFFTRKQQLASVAQGVLANLTPEQREALKWALPELK